jgi:hypothetical protein
MTTAVARKKSNSLTFQRSDNERVRRRPERRVDTDLFDFRQLGHLIQTAAADDANANC